VKYLILPLFILISCTTINTTCPPYDVEFIAGTDDDYNIISVPKGFFNCPENYKRIEPEADEIRAKK